MDNKDFDKIFSDGLEEEQDFGFQEKDWEEVSWVIHAQPKRKFVWWRWLVPVLLIAFGGVVYCLASDLKSARKEISVLHHDIGKLQIIKSDTQYQKVTIIEYDTIRKTIIDEQIVSKKRIVYIDVPGLKSESNTNKNTKSNTNLLNTSKRLGLSESLERGAEEIVEPLGAIDLLEPISLQLEDELKAGKTKEEHFYKTELKPSISKPWHKNKLKIGITNAWGVSESSTNDFYERNAGDKVKKYMLDLGVQGEWAFNHRWRVSGTVAYDRIRLLSPMLSEEVLSQLNLDPSLGNLLSSKTIQAAIHYKIGIKYYLRTHQKWLPYGGVYASAQSNRSQKISTIYTVNYQPGIVNSKTTLRKNKFRMNSLTQFFGYEFRLSDKFSWQVEQWWRINLWKTDDQMYSTFGIRNTVLYHF